MTALQELLALLCAMFALALAWIAAWSAWQGARHQRIERATWSSHLRPRTYAYCRSCEYTHPVTDDGVVSEHERLKVGTTRLERCPGSGRRLT